MDSPTLAALGWDSGWDRAFAPHLAAGLAPGRVIAAHRGAWVVASDGGDRDAVISGRLRHDAAGPEDLPAVGDWVAHSPTEPAVIAAVLPRRSAFRRNTEDDASSLSGQQVLAANVDAALVVAGLDGDLNLRRIERYLAVAWSGGATPVVVLNKSDIAGDLDRALVAVGAVAPGVEVRPVSGLDGDGIASLSADHLGPGRTAVLIGSSGVGKSTIVNALLGAELIRTGEVRADDSRGRHTTTHRELHRLPSGGLLIDTPGIRSLGVAGADAGLSGAFADIEALAADCRFADCRHESEPGCAVRSALADGRLSPERFASHRKLEREAAHVARQGDRLLAEAERRRWRLISSAGREHMARKYGSER